MMVINLFFIPMISVYIYYKLKHRELRLDAEFIALYMINCSVVAVVTKLALFIAKYLFALLYTEVASAYYSFAAVIIALIIPFVLKMIKLEVKDN